MRTEPVRDKHLKLNQGKIDRAKAILHARTETETIEKALDMVIAGDVTVARRKQVIDSILARRDRIAMVTGDVADWINEGRKERDKLYGG